MYARDAHCKYRDFCVFRATRVHTCDVSIFGSRPFIPPYRTNTILCDPTMFVSRAYYRQEQNIDCLERHECQTYYYLNGAEKKHVQCIQCIMNVVYLDKCRSNVVENTFFSLRSKYVLRDGRFVHFYFNIIIYITSFFF